MIQLPKEIKIIYASASGNVEVVCEYVAQILEGHHFEVELHRSELVDAAEIIKGRLFIFATSTWEHGEISPYFQPVINDFTHLDLEYKYAGFIGLGDIRYEPVYFCGGIDQALQSYTQSGGQQISRTLKIDGNPYHQLEAHVRPWVNEFISELINHSEIDLL